VLLAPKVCIALGGLTYPLYLLHQNLGYALMHGLDPVAGRWAALAGAVVVATALAWLIHRHVEPAGRGLILRLGDAARGRFGVFSAQRS
jgi:peptidoglycan/LPS O-acetylase OafA/YrhL